MYAAGPSSCESWLEIHKSPKDVWSKEIVAANSKAQRSEVAPMGRTSPSVQVQMLVN